MTDNPMPGRPERLRALAAQDREERLALVGALPTTSQLYRCWPFLDRSLERDCVAAVEAELPMLLLHGAPARALRDALLELADHVTAAHAWAAAGRALEYARDDGLRGALSTGLTDLYWRLAYYSWNLGERASALAVVEHAFAEAHGTENELHRAQYLATVRDALRTTLPNYDFSKRNRDRAHMQSMTSCSIDGLLALDVVRAEATRSIEEAKRDRAALKGALDRILDNPEGEVQPDIYQVLPEPEVHEPRQPGLVVVGDLSHLPQTKTDRGAPFSEFEVLAGAHLVARPMPDIPQTASALKSVFPWMQGVIDRALETQVGRAFPSLPPLLLVGPPGCGKNEFARTLGTSLGMAVTEYACGGAMDSSFGGTSRQWHSGRASVPLQAIRRSMTPNPLILLDELEKAGTDRRNGALVDVLLGMLEPGSRREFFDLYIEAPVDLSGVSFVATCNRTDALRGPLLDRFLVLEVPPPRRENLDVIVGGILHRMRHESGVDGRFLPDLDAVEMDVLRGTWRGGSIRPLQRAVARLVALRQSPRLAH
jgi:hypothetical protein